VKKGDDELVMLAREEKKKNEFLILVWFSIFFSFVSLFFIQVFKKLKNLNLKLLQESNL